MGVGHRDHLGHDQGHQDPAGQGGQLTSAVQPSNVVSTKVAIRPACSRSRGSSPMTTATISLLALDSHATAAEAAAKRVLFEIYRGQAALALGTACFFTWRLRRALRKVEHSLETLPAHLSPQQRSQMLVLSGRVQSSANVVAEAHERIARYRWIPKVPFGSRYAANLEAIHMCLEDLSETIALGASGPFTHVVRREVSQHISSHGKPHHAA